MKTSLSATLTLLVLLAAAEGCGPPARGPEEVTAPVTAGDEEAWSGPGDPPPDAGDAEE